MAGDGLVTVVVQIGNSDDKLSQRDWHRFVREVRRAVLFFTEEIHFDGCSRGDSEWQNSCIVAGVPKGGLDGLSYELSQVRRRFDQDSVALIVGEVEFV